MEDDDDARWILRPCICGNRETGKFKCYQSDDGDLLGVFCDSCGKEWLQERFLEEVPTENYLLFKNRRLYQHEKKKVTTTTVDARGQRLKEGDHIRWSEKQGRVSLNFDAIVESVQGSIDNPLVSVILMQKLSFCQLTFGRMLIDVSKLRNIEIVMYTPESDQVDLVTARASAWCSLVSEACNLFTTKAKAFASYCKCGPGHSWRVMWFGGGQMTETLKALLGSSWITGQEDDCQTIVGEGCTKAKIRAGILFVADGTAIGFDLEDSIKERSVKVNREDFLNGFINRLIGALNEHGCSFSGAVANEKLGGGIGCVEIPSVQVRVSVFIGTVLKGRVPRAPQKAVGSSFGRAFGQIIHMSVKRGDEAVDLVNIHPGDQVVLPGHVSHPRCHAIVISVSTKSNKLKLIRNTYEKGIVEEWVEVSPPVLRVTYPPGETFPAEKAIERARSRLGEHRYNILMYNCKHFAAWCKLQEK